MNDDQLREIFRASRASEHRATPPFARVLAAPAKRKPGRGALVGGLLAAGSAAAVLVIALSARTPSDSVRDLEMAHQVMAWRSSTDFLLPAASDFLISVPRIGVAPYGSPLQSLDPGSALGPPALSRSPRS